MGRRPGPVWEEGVEVLEGGDAGNGGELAVEAVHEMDEEDGAGADPDELVGEEGSGGAGIVAAEDLGGELDQGEGETLAVHPLLANQRGERGHDGPEAGEEDGPVGEHGDPGPPGKGLSYQWEAATEKTWITLQTGSERKYPEQVSWLQGLMCQTRDLLKYGYKPR